MRRDIQLCLAGMEDCKKAGTRRLWQCVSGTAEFGGCHGRCCCKVISFPKNEEDIEADFTDGYDLVSVRNKYKNMLHRYVDEYQIMLAFKGQTNIVSCDDFEAKPHKDGIGWDVFIRMELLTPLTTLIKQYAGIIPEEMVIKSEKISVRR